MEFNKIVIKINLVITQIEKYFDDFAFDLVAINYAAITPNEPSNYNNLSTLDKIVFNIKNSWGQFSSTVYPYMFGESLQTPDYNRYLYYYNSISMFYNETYFFRNEIGSWNYNKRLLKLINLVSDSNLPVITSELINLLIDDFLFPEHFYGDKARESEQVTLIKLLNLLRVEDCDDVMDHLTLHNYVEVEDGKTIYISNFEWLYKNLDSGRIQRYPIVNLFTSGGTNQKYYIDALYKIWKNSKYSYYDENDELKVSTFWNSAYTEDYFQPEATNINVEAIDRVEGSNFEISQYKINGLIVKRINTDTLPPLIHLNISKQVIVYTERTRKDIGGGGSYKEQVIVSDKRDITYDKTLHLYHPVNIMGFEGDNEVVIPENKPVPIFLFYYLKEYKELKEFDAKVALVLNLTIEAVTFLISGGLTSLTSLLHMRAYTQVGKWMYTLSTVEKIINVKILFAINETIQFTSGCLYAAREYVALTAEDEETVEMANLMSDVLFYLMLASTGSGIYLSNKAQKSIISLYDEIEIKTLNNISIYPSSFAPEKIKKVDYFLTKLLTANNSESIKLVAFKNKLPQNIILEFDNLLIPERIQFMNSYGKRLSSLNNIENITDFINNWKVLNSFNASNLMHEIDLLQNSTKFNLLKGLFEIPEIASKVRTIPISKLKVFLKEYATVSSTDKAIIEATFASKPRSFDYILSSILPKAKDPFSFDDFQKCINNIKEGVLFDINYLFMAIRNEKSITNASQSFFETNVCSNFVNIPKSTSLNLRNLKLSGSEIDAEIDLDLFGFRNKMYIQQIKINDNVITVFSEKYILSGKPQRNISNFGTTLPPNVIELNLTSDQARRYELMFEKYATIAENGKIKTRISESENKLIFLLMENHLSGATKIEIDMTSLLNMCQSCQISLQCFKQFCNELEIQLILNTQANRDINSINKLLN
jgi:hypothetical protein